MIFGEDVPLREYFLRVKKIDIDNLYAWQSECLGQEGVLDHTRNLVYCAPTSGGKSLVADLLVAKRLLRNVDDHAPIALMVLPFVSLCKERLAELTEMYETVGVQVRGFFGGRPGHLPPRYGRGGLIIATPERANDIVSKLIADDRVDELVTVVVDELHMVQHETRGSILERMLTKLMYATRDVDRPVHDHLRKIQIAPPLQVIAMSATLPRPFGLDALARWLGDAVLYETTFRPVDLRVKIVSDRTIYPVKHNDPFGDSDEPLDEIGTRPVPKDVDIVPWLAKQTLADKDGGGVMIFCAAKFQCRDIARMMRSHCETSEAGERLAGDLGGSELAECVAGGVAWHHADLSVDEKSVVERGFRENIIKVVCCTSTMATGVNLPASRVIVYAPYRYRSGGHELIGSRELQQMTGRAGRAGFGTRGEAFIIAPRVNDIRDKFWNPLHIARELGRRILSKGDRLQSKLAREGMRPVMLEGVACGLISTPEHVKAYCKRTLLAALDENAEKDANEALEWLRGKKFITELEPTDLGRAASAAHLMPEEVEGVVEDIQRVRDGGLILTSDLHPLSLCVEPSARDIDIRAFIDIYSRLGPLEQAVAEAVGIEQGYVFNRLHRRDRTPEHERQRRACHRLFRALQLRNLISEVPVENVSGIKDRAEVYAGQVAAVCGAMGWGDMEGLLIRLRDRISAGTKEELMGLMSIPQIGATRARKLYGRGVKTVEAVASKTREDLLGMLGRTSAWVVDAILDGAKKVHNERRMAAIEESEAKLRELQPPDETTVWFPDDKTPPSTGTWRKRKCDEEWLADSDHTSHDDVDAFQRAAPHANIKQHARNHAEYANRNPMPTPGGYWNVGGDFKTRQSIGSSGSTAVPKVKLYPDYVPEETKNTKTVWRL